MIYGMFYHKMYVISLHAFEHHDGETNAQQLQNKRVRRELNH